MFEAGDRVREIATGDEGIFINFAIEEENVKQGYGDGRPGCWVSWKKFNGAHLWITTDEIEAVQDAS